MKKLLSSLFLAGLLVSKLTVFQVNATEVELTVDEPVLLENPEENQESEIHDNFQLQEDAVNEDLSIFDLDNEQNTNKPIDLKWNPDKPGSFSFNANNTEGNEIIVYLYKDGLRQFGLSGGFTFNNISEGDVSSQIEESGDYTFRVHVVLDHEDFFNDDKGIISNYSDVFHYIKPEQKIDAPIVAWDDTKPGRIIWSDVQHAQTYEINVSDDGFKNTWVSRGKFIDNEDDFSSVLKSNTIYELRARAYSDNINLYAHSDYSKPVEYYFVGTDNINTDDNNIQSIITNNLSSNHSDDPNIEFWTPITEEEQLRYSCFGKENVQYTTLNNQPYSITIQNAMQGEKCFDVFRNVAGDYTIARTYNIYPLESETKYTTNNKVTISLTIPEALRQENREFKMICVSQNGVPYIFEDQDKDPKTITFSTDKFYAFALIYKDAK